MRICIILNCVVNVFSIALEVDPDRNVSCGIDFSPITPVYEGIADIETYPWLGILYYPLETSRVTTVVVLVTRQLVIGFAAEIDKVPKDDFRRRSRVVLGGNCSGPGLRVRDYVFHPEFEAKTYSTLALLQLNVDVVQIELFPICGPPTHFVDVRIYALTLNDDCENPIVKIHEMEYVNMKNCHRFYRRTGLDVDSLWPTQTMCARALSGGECVWRSGAALVTKLGGRWHLLGYGVYGPGCNAPARFMDYGVYVRWVKTNVARMGLPAVSRLGPGHIILRRKLSNLQRFGRCDLEEMKKELYTDTVEYRDSPETKNRLRTVRYNITIADQVEYTCVIFKIFHKTNPNRPSPILRLRRWCSRPQKMCFGFQMIRIDFYMEMQFVGATKFKLSAYGREKRVLDPKAAMLYVNSFLKKPPININLTNIDSAAFWP